MSDCLDWRRLIWVGGLALTITTKAWADDRDGHEISLEPPAEPKKIWSGDIGGGLLAGVHTLELKVSRGIGVAGGGPKQAHDFWFVHAQFGNILNNVWAPGHWYGGNVELTGQLFGGVQDHPKSTYFTGLNGGLRYHFATGGRLNPFIAGSVGVAATGVGLPDLSTVFEFNEQIGAGLRYFINDHQAITLEYFSQHISNAGIALPNDGVNAHFICLGYSWLF